MSKRPIARRTRAPRAAVFVYVTASGREEAARLGQAIVRERLAACANVIAPMTSFYWWQGKLEKGNEAVLILKTRASLAAAVVRRVKALHSYSCPCAVALPIVAGNPAFLDWIVAETAGGATRKRR